MGFPKIPDSQEIAAIVSKSLDPMLDLLTGDPGSVAGEQHSPERIAGHAASNPH
jgi:hypothetical protein